MRLKISLPWPGRDLWPNTHKHWRSRATAAKAAREHARLITLSSRWDRWKTLGKDTSLPVRVTFCPPDNRRRDLDGMYSACKPYQDGVADALGLDDTRFHPVTLIRAGVERGGAVYFEIGD